MSKVVRKLVKMMGKTAVGKNIHRKNASKIARVLTKIIVVLKPITVAL